MKFLIVDDSDRMRRCIKDYLPPTIETVECPNGDKALAAFVEHRPDWVLMDIEMKPIDGLTAAKQIRTEWPGAKIISVTSYEMRMDANERQSH